MITYKELAEMDSYSRNTEIFIFIKNELKNESNAKLVKIALLGKQNLSVKKCKEAMIISELACKGFLTVSQSDDLSKVCEKKIKELQLNKRVKLIDEIIETAKASAKKSNSKFDEKDLFIKLSFIENKKLVKLHSQIC